MREKSGFTLVELIVVSALLMIVGGGLLTTFITGQTSYLSADAYVQVQQEARRAFDNVVRELREAGNVTPTGATNQLNFQIARGYNTEPGSATTSPQGCQSPPAICWGSENATGEYVHYATLAAGSGNAAQLIRWTDGNPVLTWSAGTACTAAASCRVLANHVNSANFNYASGTKVVTVSLKIQYNSPLLPGGSQSTPTLISQVKLRN